MEKGILVHSFLQSEAQNYIGKAACRFHEEAYGQKIDTFMEKSK